MNEENAESTDPPDTPPHTPPEDPLDPIALFADMSEIIELSDEDDEEIPHILPPDVEQQIAPPAEQRDPNLSINNIRTPFIFITAPPPDSPRPTNPATPTESIIPEPVEGLATGGVDPPAHPKNLAQWVGSELVKELEIELAHVKSKLISQSSSENGVEDDTPQTSTGDAEILINELMEEVSKIGAEIHDLHLEQERLKTLSGRSARGELKARLDAAIAENLILRQRREEIRCLLEKIIDTSSPASTSSASKHVRSSRATSELSLNDIQKEVDNLKAILSEAKRLGGASGSLVTQDVNVGTTQLVETYQDRELLLVQFNNLKEQLDARTRRDDHLQERVDDLEAEIARLKHELETLTKNLARTNRT